MIKFSMTDEEAIKHLRERIATADFSMAEVSMILDRFEDALDTIYQAEQILDKQYGLIQLTKPQVKKEVQKEVQLNLPLDHA